MLMLMLLWRQTQTMSLAAEIVIVVTINIWAVILGKSITRHQIGGGYRINITYSRYRVVRVRCYQTADSIAYQTAILEDELNALWTIVVSMSNLKHELAHNSDDSGAWQTCECRPLNFVSSQLMSSDWSRRPEWVNAARLPDQG